MPNLETSILQRVRLILGGIPGLKIFRNNVGKLEDRFGRWVIFGLCPGSSDLIGWRSIIVTPEMVGKPVAVFVAIEIKVPGGRRAPDQKAFIAAVQQAGGIAGFADSDWAAVEVINGR